MNIEPLENRIAPASLVNFVDVDGDEVTILISGDGAVASTFVPTASGMQLQLLDLTDPAHQDATVTVKIAKSATGDGLVNIGRIDATNVDLAKVKIPGDLGVIDCGDADTSTSSPALKLLSVRSIGGYGAATGAPPDLASDVHGALGKLKVAGDIRDAGIRVTDGSIASIRIGGSLDNGAIFSSGEMGPVSVGSDIIGRDGAASGTIGAGGKIARLTLGGSLVGGSTAFSGHIQANGGIGALKIGDSLIGGSGDFSGQIQANGGIGSLKIGGSVIGGSSAFSGQIQDNGDTGFVKIGGDIVGGTEAFSGNMALNGDLRGLFIGGSLIGGDGDFSGVIACSQSGPITIGGEVRGGSGDFSARLSLGVNRVGVAIGGSLIGGAGSNSGGVAASDLASLTIGGDLIGASIAGSEPSLIGSGYIESGRIGRIAITGSIITGIDNSTGGALIKNASIRASKEIGAIKVGGSLIGNVTTNGASPVIISANGDAASGGANVAIGKINVGGSVERTNLFGGYSVELVPSDGVQIGAVKVGGDWIASNLVAGVTNLGADDTPGGTGANADNANFGDAHDTFVGLGSVTNRIAMIIIGGVVVGTAEPGDHFGFSSHVIGSFKSLGFAAALTSATDAPIELSLPTGDVTIRET